MDLENYIKLAKETYTKVDNLEKKIIDIQKAINDLTVTKKKDPEPGPALKTKKEDPGDQGIENHNDEDDSGLII